MKYEKLLQERQSIIDEIESHYGMRAVEVACDKKLSKDRFFKERDARIDEIDSLMDTEMF